MTITYQSEVATGSLSGFSKLLIKWRGSVYKLIYKEMLLFTLCYTIISIVYRRYLNEEQRIVFEKVSLYCSHYIDLIPLSFVLGFYVTFVVQRWWTQFITIPFPDRLMNLVTLYIRGDDERGRLIRRTLMRYWNLSFVLMMRSISVAVKKRFPELNHLVEAGFMTEEEYSLYESTQTKINKFWIPMTWFIKLLDQTRIEGRTQEGVPLKHIMEVVTWATHLFFIVSLIGRQYLDPTKNYPGQEVDLFIPFFTLMQFLFYMGWLKVAEQLINPFGEDDDDVECNWLIDRHLQVSYLGVDELYSKVPSLQKDMYWNDRQPNVPYSEAALVHKIPYYNGSTTNIKVDIRKQSLIRDPSQSNLNLAFPIHKKRKCFPCFRICSKQQPESKNKTDSWKPFSPHGKSHPLTQRTLGRRETLMAEELLAMLNSGNFRQEALKKKLSDHIEGLAASNCTVEIEDESTGASGNYVLKESIRTGRFIISRTNSTRSMKSGKTDPVAYINPVALSDSSMNASRSATTSLQSTETPAPKQVTNEPSSPREGKSRETPILSSVTEVDEDNESAHTSISVVPDNDQQDAEQTEEKNGQ